MLVIIVVALAALALFTALTAATLLHRRARALASDTASLDDQAVQRIRQQKPSFTMTTTRHLNADAHKIFTALQQGAFSWLPLTTGITYPTPDRGVGATRTFTTYFFSATEQVVTNDPDNHLSTVAIRTSIPLLLTTYTQDFTLTPDASGTTITWTLTARPALFAFFPLSWTAPFLRPFTRYALSRIATHL